MFTRQIRERVLHLGAGCALAGGCLDDTMQDAARCLNHAAGSGRIRNAYHGSLFAICVGHESQPVYPSCSKAVFCIYRSQNVYLVLHGLNPIKTNLFFDNVNGSSTEHHFELCLSE